MFLRKVAVKEGKLIWFKSLKMVHCWLLVTAKLNPCSMVVSYLQLKLDTNKTIRQEGLNVRDCLFQTVPFLTTNRSS